MPPPPSTKNRNKKQPTGRPTPIPRQRTLDIYASTSTGHQVGSGISKSSSWRQSRTSKLNQQYRYGTSSAAQPAAACTTNKPPKQSTFTSCSGNPTPKAAATSPAGSTSAKQLIPIYKLGPQIKSLPKASPATAPAKSAIPLYSTTKQNHSNTSQTTSSAPAGPPLPKSTTKSTPPPPTTNSALAPPTQPSNALLPKQIFKGCRIYISGTTYPIISDRELKCQLANHGAKIFLTIRRSSTTHVIVATPSNSDTLTGTGGGLAAGKLQKEIQSKANHIKYVSVQWAMDCIKQQKKLAESRYSILSLRSSKQQSMMSLMSRDSVPIGNKENIST